MIDAALLLPKILERAGNNRELSEAAAIIAWKRIAGEGLARHAQPLRLHDATIIVEVADDVWKKQLQQMTAELISRMNKLLKREVVKAIDFRVNARALKTRTGVPRTNKVVAPPASVIASAAEIEDPDLRQLFLRAATNCIDRREAISSQPPDQSQI